MTVPPLRPAPLIPGTRPGDPIRAGLVVAITALGTLAITQDPSDIAYSVAPVLIALRLRN